MSDLYKLGDYIDYRPGTAVAAGSVVKIGKLIGVAERDIAANTTGAVSLRGIYPVAKLSTDVVAAGDALYWDAVNSRLTVTATGNTFAGHAVEAAGSGVDTVKIRLWSGA